MTNITAKPLIISKKLKLILIILVIFCGAAFLPLKTLAVEDYSITTYGGEWTQDGGTFSVNRGTDHKATINGIDSANFVYEADVRVDEFHGSGDAGIMFRSTDLAVGLDK